MSYHAGRTGLEMCRLVVPIWENWDSERLYQLGDKAYFDDTRSSYVCIKNLEVVGTPTDNTEFWQIIAGGGTIENLTKDVIVETIGYTPVKSVSDIIADVNGNIQLNNEIVVDAIGYTPVDTDNIVNNLTTTDEGYALDARQGKLLKDSLDAIPNIIDTSIEDSIVNNLTTVDAGYALDARQGKLLKDSLDAISSTIDTSIADSIVNNLTTIDEGYSLDARQGKLLKDNLDAIPSTIDTSIADSIVNNLTTIDEGYSLDASQGKLLKDILDAHMADYAAQIERVVFNCTPQPGITIIESKCYTIGKTAYLNLAMKKTDDTVFSTGAPALVTVPHTPTAGVVALSAVGATTGGTAQELKAVELYQWNKTLDLQIVTTTTSKIYVSGQYLIN